MEDRPGKSLSTASKLTREHRRRPGPACRESQDAPTAAVDQAAGKCEQSGADGAGDGELIVGADVAEADGPAGDFWASTAQPSQAALAEKLPEGQCSRPAPSFRSRMASSTVA